MDFFKFGLVSTKCSNLGIPGLLPLVDFSSKPEKYAQSKQVYSESMLSFDMLSLYTCFDWVNFSSLDWCPLSVATWEFLSCYPWKSQPLILPGNRAGKLVWGRVRIDMYVLMLVTCSFLGRLSQNVLFGAIRTVLVCTHC